MKSVSPGPTSTGTPSSVHQRSLEPVDRLLVAGVAVVGGDLRAGGNVELEDRERAAGLLALEQEPDRHLSDPDLFACGHCHRRLLQSVW